MSTSAHRTMRGKSAKTALRSARLPMPPTSFSNAMIDVYGGCPTENWQNSPQWKLWLAGVKEGTKISAWGCEEAYEEMARKALIR